MKILVDADACPVKEEIMTLGQRYNLSVIFFVNLSHEIKPWYGQVVRVDQGADSVDLKLINHMEAGDIVVSGDYGVATLALARGGYVLKHNGVAINSDNVDLLMFERHMSRKVRSQGKRRQNRHKGPSPKKRTSEDDKNFLKSLDNLIKSLVIDL